MDPDCAICSAPSAHECDCEAKGLEMAVRKAEHHVMQSVYSNIRTWVRERAQDYVRLNMLEFFRLLTDRRKDAYTRHMEALTLSAYYHRNAPPHPNEIARARASLKRGIDEDWRSAVRRYPEVLEYYYSLVAVTLPSDDDPVVKDPPLDALKARRSVSQLYFSSKPGSTPVIATVPEGCRTCASRRLTCDNTRPICHKCKHDSWRCEWRSSEAVNNSDLSSEAGRSSFVDSGIDTLNGSIAPSEMGKPSLEPEPNNEVPQTINIDIATIAEELMNLNVEYLIVVTGCVQSQEKQSWLGQTSGRLRSNLERLILWRNGIGPAESAIDDILSQSSEVQSSVVWILFQLSQVICALILFAQLDLSTDDPRIQPAKMYQLLKSASIAIGHNSFSSNEEFESSYNLDMEPSEVVDDLETYINCLMDLSLALPQPSLARDSPHFEDISIEDLPSDQDDPGEMATRKEPFQPQQTKLSILSIRSKSGEISDYIPREAESDQKSKERAVDIPKTPRWPPIPTIEEESEPDPD